MTNLERLNLELSHQPYLPENDFISLLEENGLDAAEEYDKQDRRKMLCTVLSILQIMCNDIDLYRRVQTEFTTVSAATDSLNKRIVAIKNEILSLDQETAEAASCVTYLFRGR